MDNCKNEPLPDKQIINWTVWGMEIHTKYATYRPHIYRHWVMGCSQKDFGSSIPQGQDLNKEKKGEKKWVIELMMRGSREGGNTFTTSCVYFLIGTVNARASPRSAILSIIVLRSIKRLWGFRSLQKHQKRLEIPNLSKRKREKGQERKERLPMQDSMTVTESNAFAKLIHQTLQWKMNASGTRKTLIINYYY